MSCCTPDSQQGSPCAVLPHDPHRVSAGTDDQHVWHTGSWGKGSTPSSTRLFSQIRRTSFRRRCHCSSLHPSGFGILNDIVIVSWPPKPTCSTPLGVGLEAGGVKNPGWMIAFQTVLCLVCFVLCSQRPLRRREVGLEMRQFCGMARAGLRQLRYIVLVKQTMCLLQSLGWGVGAGVVVLADPS